MFGESADGSKFSSHPGPLSFRGGSRGKRQPGLIMCQTLPQKGETVTQSKASYEGKRKVGCLSLLLTEPLVASQTKSRGLVAVLWEKGTPFHCPCDSYKNSLLLNT